MARLNLAPTKSNLLSMKEQLAISTNGYELLEEKREILVRELMHIVERVKILERDIEKVTSQAYPALKNMLMTIGGDRATRIAHSVKYDFSLKEKSVNVAGLSFQTIEGEMPKQKLFSSFSGTFAESDKVQREFFKLLELLTQMASIRTIAWRLALEVKKMQRRVNALDKVLIPETRETIKYIEEILEERERDNIFTLKTLKNKLKKSISV